MSEGEITFYRFTLMIISMFNLVLLIITTGLLSGLPSKIKLKKILKKYLKKGDE